MPRSKRLTEKTGKKKRHRPGLTPADVRAWLAALAAGDRASSATSTKPKTGLAKRR
jgi:hypothetical protein